MQVNIKSWITKHVDNSNTSSEKYNDEGRTEKQKSRAVTKFEWSKQKVSMASLYTLDNGLQIGSMKRDTGNWKAETAHDLRSKDKKMLCNNILM